LRVREDIVIARANRSCAITHTLSLFYKFTFFIYYDMVVIG